MEGVWGRVARHGAQPRVGGEVGRTGDSGLGVCVQLWLVWARSGPASAHALRLLLCCCMCVRAWRCQGCGIRRSCDARVPRVPERSCTHVARSCPCCKIALAGGPVAALIACACAFWWVRALSSRCQAGAPACARSGIGGCAVSCGQPTPGGGKRVEREGDAGCGPDSTAARHVIACEGVR